MKNENIKRFDNKIVNADEHDLFHLFKLAECIKVTSVIPVKEELPPLELSVYNFLLSFCKNTTFPKEEFTLKLLMKKLEFKYTDDDLVNAFRNLDKKYYTESAFDDKGQCVWIKLL